MAFDLQRTAAENAHALAAISHQLHDEACLDFA
jgi:hypothetical protein